MIGGIATIVVVILTIGLIMGLSRRSQKRADVLASLRQESATATMDELGVMFPKMAEKARKV